MTRGLRLWPANLAGRIFLIIIAGLVVAHVASYAFFEIERMRSIDRFLASDLATRITDAARAPVTSLPSHAREGVLLLRHRVRWRDVEKVGAAPQGEHPSTQFMSELRRLLEENFEEDPIAWTSITPFVANTWLQRPAPLTAGEMPASPPGEIGSRSEAGPRVDGGGPPRGEGGGPPSRGGGPRMMPDARFQRPTQLLTVALKFKSGREAMVETPYVQPVRGIPAEAWTAIALVFAVTAIFTILAVRLAVRPVRMLGEAADRLSRNIEEPPLPEKGADDIRTATRAFNRMQDRLRRHVNSRSLAFAAMSHDIRTPLTRMRLKLESLGDEARESLETELDEIQAISSSALEMTRDLAPDESIVPVDIEALVDKLVRDYAAMGVVIPVTGHAPAVNARPAALRRALGNLVDNAIKYGREVSVDLGEAREHATIEVADRGPGIPEDDLPRVVYPFYRVESSRNRETGGAGLGLAIAKDIVEGQG
ncbi:MAG: ATP-binding protein, partial [Usitatibacter sp.]